jgi:Ca2+-binding RTX toxin-like protein
MDFVDDIALAHAVVSAAAKPTKYVGTAGDDSLGGGTDANIVQGLGGNDTLVGYAGDDTLIGGDGDDQLLAGDGADRLNGGRGKDYLQGDNGADLLFGGAGDDTLVGDFGQSGYDAYDDTIMGEAGNDITYLDAGNDRIDGGADNDLVSLQLSALAGVNIRIGVEIAQNFGAVGHDTLISIEGAIGSDYDDRITGNALNNVLYGAGGDDLLKAGDGNDLLRGGAGDDTLIGGSGYDRASFGDSPNGVEVSLAKQGHVDSTGAGNDLLIGFEYLSGSNRGDILTGDGKDNWLIGQGGTDILIGGQGDDMLGATIGDSLDGGEGRDTVQFDNFYLSAVTLDLSIQATAQETGSGPVTLWSIENVDGSGFDDRLTGDAGVNVLGGDGGDDTLHGGGGRDVLLGDGGFSADLGAGSWTLTAITRYDSFAGVIGNDVLDGGDGADVLIGGAGADTMTGGAGGDHFVYLADSLVLGGDDLITDLQAGDVVDLSAIDTGGRAGDQAFRQVDAFTGNAGQAVLAYDAESDTTTLSLDGDSDAIADMTISMAGDQRDFAGFVL